MNPKWADRAACVDEPTYLFFPRRNDLASLAAAKAICAFCPVRDDCLEAAIREEVGLGNNVVGVRGGLSARQRRDRYSKHEVCGWCSALFVRPTRSRRYCSQACSAEADRRRKVLDNDRRRAS